MSDNIIQKGYEYRAHSSIQTEFWLQFLEAMSEEKILQKASIEEKEYYWDIDAQTETEDLITIAKTFGYSPVRVLDDSLDYLKLEVKSIFFRIKKKTTYDGYDLIFKMGGLSGEVFNLYFNGTKLLKALDFDVTEENLIAHTNYLPFNGVAPIESYSTILEDVSELDTDTFIDDSSFEYLDQSIYQQTTNYITVEYLIESLVEEDGIKYLTTPSYQYYLRLSVAYNKKCTEVANSGFSVSGITDSSGKLDIWQLGSEYTIPELELNITTTPTYRKLSDTQELVYLDEERELDETISWYLDQNSSGILDKDTLFTSIVYGTGVKAMDKVDNSYGYTIQEVVIYLSFSEDFSTSAFDESLNSYDVTIVGGLKSVEGIVSRTLEFSSTTYAVSEEDIRISSANDTTFAGWFSFSSLSSSIHYLFSYSGVYLAYDQINSYFIVGIDSVETYIPYTLTEDTDFYFNLQYSIVDETLSLYINATLIQSIDISSLIFPIDGDILYIGTSETLTENWEGKIDDFLILNSSISVLNQESIINNLYGNLSALQNEIGRISLSSDEVNELTSYFMINSFITSNTVKNEKIGVGNGVTSDYSGSTNIDEVNPKSFCGDYSDVDNNQINFCDDGLGSIILPNLDNVGTIDYTSGEYTLTLYKDEGIEDEILFSGATTTITSIIEENLVPSSLLLKFSNGVSFEVTDNGLGAFNSSSAIVTSAIDYDTGEIYIEFSPSTIGGADILLDYSYRTYYTPENEAEIIISYSSEQSIQITEIGLLDDNNQMTCYMTFPPAYFDNTRGHISPNLFVVK